MIDPKVSAIIPSYRHESTVAETVTSVLGQTYTNIEIILIDDNSPDRTFEIAKNLIGDKGICIKKTRNAGIVDSLNTAFNLCTGDIVTMIASDDYWYPNYIERMVDQARQHPGAIIQANADIIDASGNFLRSFNSFSLKMILDPPKMRSILRKRYPFPAMCVAYPIEFIRKISPIPSSVYLEDWWLRWASVANNITCVCIPERLAAYRFTPQSMTRRNKIRMIKWRIKTLSNILNFMKPQDVFPTVTVQLLRCFIDLLKCQSLPWLRFR